MGSCFTTFHPSAVIPGQGYDVVTAAEHLCFTKHDLDLMYRYFRKVDVDESGFISLTEFIVVNRITSDSLGELVFGLMDRNYDKKLNFYEFLLACWNYLTLDRDTLILFFFDIYDIDHSGVLTADEVKHLVGMIWRFRIDAHIQRIFDVLDADGDKEITINELSELSRHSDIILFPAFTMQGLLREGTLGFSRWQQLTDIRQKKFGRKSVFEVIDGLDRRKALLHSLSLLGDHPMEKRKLQVDKGEEMDLKNDYYHLQSPVERSHFEFGKSSGDPYDSGYPRGYHHHHHTNRKHFSEEKHDDRRHHNEIAFFKA